MSIFVLELKAEQVDRPVMEKEVIKFSDSFDLAYPIKCDLQGIFVQAIPLTMMTDSLSLFEFLEKGSLTTEKGLMIDLQIKKESNQNAEIHDVSFIVFR